MKKYTVVSRKPVSVRIGTQDNSEIKEFPTGSEFETSEAFAADLLKQGYVKEVEAKQSKSSKESGK